MATSIFEFAYPDVEFNLAGETQVCCKFPHTIGEVDYEESNPSAGINLLDKLYHCFTCGKGLNELQFAQEYLKTSTHTAKSFIKMLDASIPLTRWEDNEVFTLMCNDKPINLLTSLNITKQTYVSLKIGYTGEGFSIPIIYNDTVLDYVTYRPGMTPKYLRKKDTVSGLVCPYDVWRRSKAPTIVCAGEKDMLIARSKGLNAISFTGGEMVKPKLLLDEFKDRNVFIIFDNDDAGRSGSESLANILIKYTDKVHIVDISDTCVEKGEDLWDYFCKYNKSVRDLAEVLKVTPVFTPSKCLLLEDEEYPTISLHSATTEKYVGKIVKSCVQVVATIDSTFTCPTIIEAVKTKVTDDDTENKMTLDEERFWELNDNNLKDMFYLIDSKLKENQIDKYIRSHLLFIPSKEKGVTITKKGIKPVYKIVVSDMSTGINDNTPVQEFTAFSINTNLENGKKYIITYRLIPHPQDGQKLVMVVKDVEESDDFLDNFELTDQVKNNLRMFQREEGEKVSDKLEELVNRTKGILHTDYDDHLILVEDLWFNTPLQYTVRDLLGVTQYERAYLDILLIGDSRIGKSKTVEGLQSTYGLGKVVSLAGGAATPTSIIGGSNKTAGGSFQTRAGVIAQNNKGAIVFEELAKCDANLVSKLTDIRSSNKVRISRVSGSLELPAYVRLLTLTNNKSKNGVKSIKEYPNGISIINELVSTQEDIARYDLIPIFAFDESRLHRDSPFFRAGEPFPQQVYKDRIRWIWSRTPEQVYITNIVYNYAWNKSGEIRQSFNSKIQLFGIECYKKIIRFAIAIAGYLCSTDITFENIVVNEEHVDAAVDLMIKTYDNDVFKFREYVLEERATIDYTYEDVELLQRVYEGNTILLEALERCTEIPRMTLIGISGDTSDSFNRTINILYGNRFITHHGTDILPTPKFKSVMSKINRGSQQEVNLLNV